ncbi:serine/threonine-protein kinase [Kitasatospora sp. LaBMicrA B282]|uniref:serine/threonine-protein kinase n=1 Tax=Kitasatospora sp. LaBMicrA B282 TaxID=3420949 RepID=UPI003D145BAD
MTTGGPDPRLIDGRFELLQRLGGGGMGLVWRALDTALQREVALKEVRPADPETAADPALAREIHERVLREARALARLQHPNVAVIHHIVDRPDYENPWLVMELVTGGSLADRLARGPLGVAEAVRIGRGVLAALRAAHAVGIHHRDVKPGNVLLRPDGTPVLTDFGIAAVSGATALTSTGALIGSPEFMAPERIRGEEGNPSSDLWSLGMTLYVAVEGQHPLRRTSVIATLAAMLDEPLPPARQAGPLGPVLDALLVKDPALRPTAEQLDRALAQAGYEAEYGAPAAPVGGQPIPTVVVTPATVPAPTVVITSMPQPTVAVQDRGPTHGHGHGHGGVLPPGKSPEDLRYLRRWRTGITVFGLAMIGVIGTYSFVMMPGRFNSTSSSGTPATTAPVTLPAGLPTAGAGTAGTAGASGGAGGTGAKAAASPSTAAVQDLTTPAGVRATIATMRSTMGGTQVYELDVHETSANAQVPVAGTTTEYDDVDYAVNSEPTRRQGSEVTPDMKLVDLQNFDWDLLPQLWQKAAATLNVPNPTDHYLIIGPDVFGNDQPSIRLYLDNGYGSGYLQVDTKGNVIRTIAFGS